MQNSSKKIIALLGPTNTGKTHDAIEKMLEFESGIFGLPLRLLAREVYEKCAKKIGSNKMVYGFDTFSGFPPNSSEQDNLENFELYKGIHFEESLVNDAILSKKIKENLAGKDINISNISSSLDFSNVTFEELENKITYLGLDNIKLIKGDFKDTIGSFFDEYTGQVFAANIDCDLYDGYMSCLPYLCDRLSSNGYIHLDEYYSLKFPGARLACIEFLESIDPSLNITLKKNKTSKEEFERWYITKA